MSDTLQPHGLQHTRLPCPSLSPRVCSNSCPLSEWCYLTISSSATLFSFCLQSFPASGSFPVSQLSASGGQSIGASASASIFLMNIHGWFPLGLTGFIFLQSKGLSRVFSTTSWNHQFFGMYISIFKHNSAFSIFFWVLKNTRREKHYFTLLILFMGFCCYSQFHSWICSDSEFTYSDSI